MSVVSYLKLSPKKEFLKQFEGELEELTQLVRKQKGFVSFEVLHPRGSSAEYVILSEWETEADFKAWEHSPRHEEVMKDYEQRTGQGYTKMRMNRYR